MYQIILGVKLIPGLKEVNMSNVASLDTWVYMQQSCPDLEKLRWDAACESARIIGMILGRCRNLRELYLDNCNLVVPNEEIERNDNETYFLDQCNSKLECVSLRNASYHTLCRGLQLGEETERKEMSQLGLMKFARLTKNLKWFRSDMSPENIAKLRIERPEVTFLK
mmetsp:Transcript_16243/g.46813  ORF Transcript_16243/g.46813 Transcript_16243/m.46813 type:complete len:167 (-) Transcript_16243:190-690(-)